MLAETDILSPSDACQIAGALEQHRQTKSMWTALEYTGEYEDYFFLVEAELKRRLGDLGGALHTARSRNDMDHTLFKLALRDQGRRRAQTRILRLADALTRKSPAKRQRH